MRAFEAHEIETTNERGWGARERRPMMGLDRGWLSGMMFDL